MTEKLERMCLNKACSGKASKAWLKSVANGETTPVIDAILDAAFPGWRPRRGIGSEELSLVDDVALAYDLSPSGVLEPRLQAVMDRWIALAATGDLDETLWRHLDATLGNWAAKLGNKRTHALRLRAVQFAGFRAGAGRDPQLGSSNAFERSLAGWVSRNRTKNNKGSLSARDAAIITGRVGQWTRKL